MMSSPIMSIPQPLPAPPAIQAPAVVSVLIPSPQVREETINPSLVTPAEPDPEKITNVLLDDDEDEAPVIITTAMNICGDKEKVGRWTEQEHLVFLEGLQSYGKQWKTIAGMIGTRTVVQVRTHAQKYFQKMERQGSSANLPLNNKPKKRKSMPELGSSSNSSSSSSATGTRPSKVQKGRKNSPRLSLNLRSTTFINVDSNEISEELQLPSYPSYVSKSSSSGSVTESWNAYSPNTVVTDVLEFPSAPIDNQAMVVEQFDFTEDPLEWLIDSEMHHLPESSLPLFPDLNQDHVVASSSHDDPVVSDQEQDSLNIVDPNVTMQSLFLPCEIHTL